MALRWPRVVRAVAPRRGIFVGAEKPSDGASQEEVDRTALQLSRLLRVLAAGWLGYERAASVYGPVRFHACTAWLREGRLFMWGSA